jgi:O-antigen/teichoic acid export membrane protein
VLMNTLGAIAMLFAIALLAKRFGINGAAAGRLAYGTVTLSMYFALKSAWRTAAIAPRLRTCENG